MKPMKSFVESRLIQLKDLTWDLSLILQGGVVLLTRQNAVRNVTRKFHFL